MAGDKALREQEFRLDYQASLGVASTAGIVYAQRVAQSGGRLRRASFSVVDVVNNGGSAMLYVRGSAALTTSVALTTVTYNTSAAIKGGELTYSKGDVFTLRLMVATAGAGLINVACDYVCWEGA